MKNTNSAVVEKEQVRRNGVLRDAEDTLSDECVADIIDHKLILLVAAGAAVQADCEQCVEKILPELKETGVTEDDIRKAVKSGVFPGLYAELGGCVLDRVCERIRLSEETRLQNPSHESFLFKDSDSGS